MEFQEALMKMTVHSPSDPRLFFAQSPPENGAPKVSKWRISFRKLSAATAPFSSKTKPPKHQQQKDQQQQQQQQQQPVFPDEFLCPISGSLMTDPVIVSSGHSFDRASMEACKALGFAPSLGNDVVVPDFSTVIPNRTLKSTILSFCSSHSLPPPKPLDPASALTLVRSLMSAQTHNTSPQDTTMAIANANANAEKRKAHNLDAAKTEFSVKREPPSHSYSSSDDSVGIATSESTPAVHLATRASCCCSSSPSSSSSEFEALSPEEEEFVMKLRSPLISDVEEALIALRDVTRRRGDVRISVCTNRLLSSLRPLIVSRYCAVQANSAAALVNLSLEKLNKVKIVRSGIVPSLIDALKGGFPETQEHAAGALFSLALDDDNKTAIGALGALQPLLHMLRSENERTRSDSASALYHLSLVHSNRIKLVRLGCVPALVRMVKSGRLVGRILLLLVNLGSCEEGRAALLDAGAVECLVGMLSGAELESVSVRDNCVAALFALSHGGLRFKGLAKAAGAAEVLEKLDCGSERAREMAVAIVATMRQRREEAGEEEVDWERVLELELGTPTL